jgi:hypothetical protein
VALKTFQHSKNGLKRVKPLKDMQEFIQSINPTVVATASAVAFAGSKFVIYSKMQFVTASLVGGIPKNFKVVEIDATDGKNVFYLPSGTGN